MQTTKQAVINIGISLTLTAALVLSVGGLASAKSLETCTSSCPFTFSGGALTSTPTTPTLSVSHNALNFADQTLTMVFPVEVQSQTGASWKVQLAMNQFLGHTFQLADANALNAFHVGITGYCITGSDCSLPDGNSGASLQHPHTFAADTNSDGVPSTYTLSAGTGTPSAQPLLYTVANPGAPVIGQTTAYYGMGDMMLTPTLTTTLIARDTYPDAYTNSATLSVIDGL